MSSKPSITDWIQAVGALVAIVAAIVAFITLIGRDLEKEKQISSLIELAQQSKYQTEQFEKQTREFKNQTNELTAAVEALRDQSIALQAQNEFIRNQTHDISNQTKIMFEDAQTNKYQTGLLDSQILTMFEQNQILKNQFEQSIISEKDREQQRLLDIRPFFSAEVDDISLDKVNKVDSSFSAFFTLNIKNINGDAYSVRFLSPISYFPTDSMDISTSSMKPFYCNAIKREETKSIKLWGFKLDKEELLKIGFNDMDGNCYEQNLKISIGNHPFYQLYSKKVRLVFSVESEIPENCK